MNDELWKLDMYPTKGHFRDDDDPGDDTPQDPGTKAPDPSGLPRNRERPASDNVLHTIKRGNEEIQVSTRQLTEMAQKGWNADKLTQSAREQEKAAQAALSVQEDLESWIQEGDQDAFRRIASMYGASEDEADQAIRRHSSSNNDEDFSDIEDFERRMGRSRDMGPVAFDKLAPDVQRVIAQVERERVNKIIEEALDSDEEIAYNLRQYDSDGQKAFKDYVRERVVGQLPRYGGDFGDGRRILKDVLPTAKAHLKALATPKTRVGLGSSPGGGDMEAYPSRKPDHVSTSDMDEYEKHISETLAYNMARGSDADLG